MSTIEQKTEEFANAKPSRVIEMALEDLEAVERQADRYEVDMREWHVPDEYRGTCSVCFAGSVMANRFGVPWHRYVRPSHWEGHVKTRLDALDAFRRGAVDQALQCMDIRHPYIAHRHVTAYCTDPEQFKRDMRTIAADLKAVGL